MNQSQEPRSVLSRLEDFQWTPRSVLAVAALLLAGVYVFAHFEAWNPWIGIPLLLLFCAPDLVLLVVAAGLWCSEKAQKRWRERREV